MMSADTDGNPRKTSHGDLDKSVISDGRGAFFSPLKNSFESC